MAPFPAAAAAAAAAAAFIPIPTMGDDETDPYYLVETTTASTSTTSKATSCCVKIPCLGFGLYKIPNDDEGERIVTEAIVKAGYRHLDSASIYGNEPTVGRAIAQCINNKNIQRSDLLVATKVWNDAQRGGRSAVRQSVLQSLHDLQCGSYLDIVYVHWPVPGHYVDTYRELQRLRQEGKIRHIGISNFTIQEYQHLMNSDGIYVPPLIHQMEISPYLYRPDVIEYFQRQGILLAASKALHRATGLMVVVVVETVTAAMIIIMVSLSRLHKSCCDGASKRD
jgi:diketogulonate reductase-like aldo/keto reductase